MADHGIVRWLLGKFVGLPPRQTRRLSIDKDLRIPMRDGVVLLADRYCAQGQASDPVVLMRSPYGRGSLFCLMAGLLAERGLQVVIQSVRGTSGSGGALDPMRQERDDGADTLSWVRAQPWFARQLYTFGGSYLGNAQWAMASAAPELIDGMALSMTLSNFRDELLGGGGFTQGGTLTWTQLMQMIVDAGPAGAMKRPNEATLERVHGHLPVGTLDEAAIGKNVRWWQEWTRHENPADPWWQAIDHSAAVIVPAVPATMVAGWQDIFLPYQLQDYAARQAAGRKDWLTIGPWTHPAPGGMFTGLREAVALFTALSAGREPNAGRQRVRLYVRAQQQWREFAAWPPPGSQPLSLHLRGGARLDLRAPPGDEGSRTYTYDPANPTPSAHGAGMLTLPTSRQLARLQQRSDVVCYTSAALTKDAELIGPVTATLAIRSNREYTDFYACLCDIDARGRATQITDGYQRLRPGQPATDATGIRQVSIDCWPTAYCVRRGHRLRLIVASGAHPRYARNLGTGEPLATATAMVTAQQQILHAAEQGSAIVLPVLGELLLAD